MLTKKEWKRRVVARCPDDIRPRARDFAMDFFYPHTRRVATAYELDGQVRECLRLAGYFQDHVASSPQTERSILEHCAGTLAEWSAVVERIRPMIEALRGQVFESEVPPFTGRYVAGVKWLQKQAQSRTNPSAADRAAAKRFIVRSRKLLRTPVTVKHVTLKYFSEDYPSTTTAMLTVMDDSPLTVFANKVGRLVRETGAHEAILIDHVLTGLPLVPPFLRVERSLHPEGRTSITVQFPSAQTALGIRPADLHQLIRDHLGMTDSKKPRSVTEKDRRFYEMCVRCRGVPAHGTDEWRRMARDHGLGSRRAALNKYRRLRSRLGRAHKISDTGEGGTLWNQVVS